MTSTQSFRLLHAELWDQNGVDVGIKVAPRAGESSWTTVVTGRNGSGKSRLLSAVAGAFDALDGRHLRNRKPLTLKYEIGGQAFALRVDGKAISASADGRVVEVDQLPRPAAVIAATASAFDKFHLPREGRFREADSVESSYRYLGLKDGRGRVSARAGIFRALEHLFEVSDDGPARRQQVSEVFRYLGYKPTVEVAYAWTYRGRDVAKNAGEDSYPAVRRYLDDAKRRGESSTRSAVPNYFLEGALGAKEIAASVNSLRESRDNSGVRLVADYREPDSGGEERLQMARQLTRAGILQLDEVVLFREASGHRVEIADASSGELSLVVTLLGIASSIKDGSLILIDEPEISLHPQWQSDYLARLEKAFSSFKGCHFVIATHSPALTAGVVSSLVNIVDVERSAAATSQTPSGRSVDEVLLSTFGVVTANNLHLRDLLVLALRGAEDGDLATAKFDKVMTELLAARPGLPLENSVGQLVDRLSRIRTKLAERSLS